MIKSIRIFISLILFLLVWQILSRSGVVSEALFPTPTHVANAFLEMIQSGELWNDIKASLGRTILGLVIGSSVGIVIGMMTGRISILNHYLSPWIQIFRPLPPVAIIPLVIVWFGIGEVSKVFSIAFAVFFPVWMNTHAGVQEIPKTYWWSAKTLHIRGVNLFKKILFPGSLPFILTGLRIAVATAYIMVFVSELAGASVGIGYEISVSQLSYRVDRMLAALILLGILGAMTDLLMLQIMWKLFPWLKVKGMK